MMNCWQRPSAIARITGGKTAPHLQGTVRLVQEKDSVSIMVNIHGLPPSDTGFFGFHIHEGTDCGGDDFAHTQSHYNPDGTPHPAHIGDLPPLLSTAGTATMMVKTDRFRVRDVIGRTLVIHSQPDDFTSQPAGNAGTKIACGVIEKG